MLKRTKGLLLLTLLVITGLAGTINDSSLSKKERKVATTLMKNTKADLLASVKGLSAKQLNFKEAPDRWSVKECVIHVAVSEKYLWNLLETTMKNSPNPEKRSELKLSDDDLINGVENRQTHVKTIDPLEPRNSTFKSVDDALNAFRSDRADHIKYLKTSTEDLRNHVVQMSFGWLDCYQLSLMIAAHSERHKKQIEEIKLNSNFPRK